jgi:hypothetical protein
MYEFGVILDVEQPGLPGGLYFLLLHYLRCVASSDDQNFRYELRPFYII